MEKDGTLEAPPSQEEAQRIFEHFREVMEMGANEPNFGHRLALAQTVVHVEITDADNLTMTLLLDREPIEIVPGGNGEAEVELYIKSRDLDRFWAGDLHLAMALAEGQVEYSGPVRKFLRVVPIMLRLTPNYREMTGRDVEASDDSQRKESA